MNCMSPAGQQLPRQQQKMNAKLTAYNHRQNSASDMRGVHHADMLQGGEVLAQAGIGGQHPLQLCILGLCHTAGCGPAPPHCIGLHPILMPMLSNPLLTHNS